MTRRSGRVRGGVGIVVIALATFGCSEPPRPAPRVSFTEKLARPDDAVVARVGALEITASMVASAARSRGTTPREALGALVDDAVAASFALKGDFLSRDDVRRDIDAALARQVLRRIHDGARAQGPLSDAELAELSQRHWKDVDLPERVRVVHAVILRKPEKRELMAKAPAAARELLAAVASATSADDFEKRANAFPKGGFEIVVQRLPAFDVDGRITEGEDGAMDKVFSKAAMALAPEATSGVVETEFGWHVIRAIERAPALQLPKDQRRELFAEEGLAFRARRAYDAVIAAQRAKLTPKIETYAEQGLATLVISAPSGPEATR